MKRPQRLLSLIEIGIRPGKFWVLIVAIAIACFAIAHYPANAAPNRQTIPFPTPTSAPNIAEPTAVPNNDARNEDANDEDDGDLEPAQDEVEDSLDGFSAPDDGSINDTADEIDSGGPAASGGQVDVDEQESLIPAQESNGVSYVGSIKDERISIYAAPNPGADVLGTATKNDRYQIVGRNRGLTWYTICCLPESVTGWVRSRAVVREFDLVDAVNLPIVDDLSDLQLEPAIAATEARGVVSADALSEAIAFSLEVNRSAARSGEIVLLTVRVGNNSDSAIQNVEVRDDLPDELEILTVDLENGSFEFDREIAGGVFRLYWPLIEPGVVEIADVQIRIAKSTTNGKVLENLALLTADDGIWIGTGVLIGMPPAALPDFR